MAEGWCKAILIQKGTLKLIDGAHRLEATQRLGKDKISVTEIDIRDSDLRAEAYNANKKHGVPYTKEERNNIIVRLNTEDGKTQEEIAGLFGIHRTRVQQIISMLETNNTNTDKRREITPDRLCHHFRFFL